VATRTAENDNMTVEFSVTDESFTHEFGVKKQTGFEIKSISVYVPALADWMDVTDKKDERIQLAADRLVERTMEQEYHG
jgi:hypothetical protein